MRIRTTADHPLAGLKTSLRGPLITRDDKDAFAAARFRGWNRDLNARANPLGFVVASGVRDIVTTVNYCRTNKLPIAVRGRGAHSRCGMANDAVVIGLMRTTAVRVDAEKKLAFIQAGADGGDVDHDVALQRLIDAFVTTLRRLHVITYPNNTMPEGEAEMLGVFPHDTMKRLRTLRATDDSNTLFKVGEAVRGQRVAGVRHPSAACGGRAHEGHR